MALNTGFKDWAGNGQTVESWMNNVDKRIAELHGAVLGLQQSRIPGDKNQTNASNIWFDEASWSNQTLGRVGSIESKVDQLAEAVRELSAKVGQ